MRIHKFGKWQPNLFEIELNWFMHANGIQRKVCSIQFLFLTNKKWWEISKIIASSLYELRNVVFLSWKTFGWKLINNRISPYLKLTSWLSGACKGDSGSPVIRRISGTGRGRPFYQQEFIASTGLDCRLRATIYTRVSQRKVLRWIQKISGTEPVVMVAGGFSAHTKEFLQAKVITS